jgi:hypothetical protein
MMKRLKEMSSSATNARSQDTRPQNASLKTLGTQTIRGLLANIARSMGTLKMNVGLNILQRDQLEPLCAVSE